MLRPLPPRASAAALIAVLLVAGLLPYWSVLGWLPWSGDALKWVARGSTDIPTWVQWDFASKHFVGYRPVTALSFTLDQWIGGYEPLAYRATDLGFYLLSGATIFAVYRLLTGDLSVLGLLPVLVVFAHPTTEDIVPESARRSYLLATTFGLSGVWVLGRAGRTAAGAVGGALLLGLAVLANEVAYVLFPLVPWFVSYSTPVRKKVVLASIPATLVLMAAVGARYLVLGTLGGYQRRIFAFVKGHTLMWHENQSWQPHNIVGALWSHTVNPISVTGAAPLFSSWAQPAFATLVGLWVVGFGLGWPLMRRADPRARIKLGLVAWTAGSMAIVVLSQTWFWRQAYAVVIPLGMLVTFELGGALAKLSAGKRAGRVRAIGTVAMTGLLFTAIAWNGPLVSGLHRGPYVNVIQGTPLARKVKRLLEPVGDGSEVYLVAPLKATGGHLLRLWGEILARPRKVTFHLLAHLQPIAAPETSDIDVVKDEDGARLVIGPGFMLATTKAVRPASGDRKELVVSRLWKPETEAWMLALDVRGAWAVRVTEPPEGVEPIDLPLDDDLPDKDAADPEPIAPE